MQKASIDLGNDSIKEQINSNSTLVLPSVIAKADDLRKVTFNTKDEEKDYFSHFEDHIDVSVSSPAVKDSGRYYIGNRAVESGNYGIRFDVNDFTGKADSDLSLILLLSNIAAQAVKDAYFTGKDIFKPITLTVNLTTALPIREAKKPDVINHYKNRFLNTSHTVVFYNFEKAISVNISFNDVLCTLEGQAAQLAIFNPKIYPHLAKSLLSDLHNNYPNLSQLTNLNLAKSVLGIDLGGKTTDFAVLENGKANINLSNSIMAGYDKVLAKAIDELQDLNRNFRNIAQLEKYLEMGPSVFDPTPYKQVENVITRLSQDFTQEIVNGVSKIIAGGINPEIVYIYGGGASAMNKYTNLRQLIGQTLKRYNGNLEVPIIYVDKKYANKLNLMGLRILQTVLRDDTNE